MRSVGPLMFSKVTYLDIYGTATIIEYRLTLL